MDGPYTLSILYDILDLFKAHRIFITNFRFLTHDEDWDIMDEFSPATLCKLFADLPRLEVLCLDHENKAYNNLWADAAPWPGRWVESRLLKVLMLNSDNVFTPG